MSSFSIPKLFKVLPQLPRNTSVLLRGDHGLGKSSLIRQVAKKIAELEGIADFPIIDRRIATMAAGDLSGLPDKTEKSTKWLPPDWYIMACEQPVALFLDELNRGENELINAAFQIVLDRELGGHRLHPQTRVFSAINTDSKYNVLPIDPALLDRFFVGDILFSLEDWLKWARDEGVPNEVLEFIGSQPDMIKASPGADPTEVTPSPRSVAAYAYAVKEHLARRRSLYEQSKGKLTTDIVEINEFLYEVAKGYCGATWASAFKAHVEAPLKFDGSDIIERFDEVQKHINPKRIDILNIAVGMVVQYVAALPNINPVQGKNLSKFVELLPTDLRAVVWQDLTTECLQRKDYIKEYSVYIAPGVCEGFGVPYGEAGIGVLPNIHGVTKATP